MSDSNNPNASKDNVGKTALELEQAEKAAKEAALNTDPSKTTGKENETTKTVEQLEQELANTKKSYDEIRADYTRRTQSESELKGQVETMTLKQAEMLDAIGSLTDKNYDPEKFMDDFKAQGPKLIRNEVQKENRRLKEEYDKRHKSIEDKNHELETQLVTIYMAQDTKQYPDFVTLLPEIDALTKDSTTPVDFNQPVPVVMKSLYNLAKSKHSGEALMKAKELGTKEAEDAAAKEAAATVAGGGKQNAPTPEELDKLPLDKLEKIVEGMHGVAEER